MRLQNEFSWSFTRANTFGECQKRYWYTYYGSWEGWPKTPWDKRPEIDPLATKLYALKQMQSLPTFIGSTVHETIEHFLKQSMQSKKSFELEALLAHGFKAFDEGIDEAKTEKWRISPKKHTNLFEFYYGPPLAQEQLDTAKEKVRLCLTNWHESKVMQSLAFHPDSRFRSIEELSSFQLAAKYKVIVVIDFCVMWKDMAVLFDWKTGGESEKTEEQLYCYALFANKVWNIPLEKIILTPYYLAKNSYTKIKPAENASKLVALEEKIVDSCNKLSVLHDNADVQSFAYPENRVQCNTCAFKEVCQGVNFENVPRDELLAIAKATCD